MVSSGLQLQQVQRPEKVFGIEGQLERGRTREKRNNFDTLTKENFQLQITGDYQKAIASNTISGDHIFPSLILFVFV